MSQKRIGIDMDEVLSESIDFIFKEINYQINGKKLDKSKIRDYNNSFKETGVSQERAVEIYTNTMLSDSGKYQVKASYGSLAKANQLKRLGYELFIITARNAKTMGQYTKDWTNEHFKGIFSDIIFAEHFTERSKNKSQLCKELGVKTMIEDNFDYALELANNGIKTYVLEKTRNTYRDEKNKDIIRVKNWDNIII